MRSILLKALAVLVLIVLAIVAFFAWAQFSNSSDLPSNAEIRDEIQRMAWLYEGDGRFDKLREMRIEALRIDIGRSMINHGDSPA